MIVKSIINWDHPKLRSFMGKQVYTKEQRICRIIHIIIHLLSPILAILSLLILEVTCSEQGYQSPNVGLGWVIMFFVGPIFLFGYVPLEITQCLPKKFLKKYKFETLNTESFILLFLYLIFLIALIDSYDSYQWYSIIPTLIAIVGQISCYGLIKVFTNGKQEPVYINHSGFRPNQ